MGGSLRRIMSHPVKAIDIVTPYKICGAVTDGYLWKEINNKIFIRHQSSDRVFTLSSHHPFKVPEKYKAKFNQMYDGLAISPTIQYTDYALRRFFASAKYKKWFQNTVFIITADHTSISKHLFYKNSLGVYNVPIVIYSPGKNMRNAIDTTNLVQHIDIYPTVLSLLGKQEQVFAFGTNVLENNTLVMNNLSGIYQFMSGNYLFRFDGEEITACYRFKQDSLLKDNIVNQLSEDTLKQYLKTFEAAIQTYDESLLENKMTANDQAH